MDGYISDTGQQIFQRLCVQRQKNSVHIFAAERGVYRVLLGAFRSRPEAEALAAKIKASGKIPYGKVVEAMDIARGAGVERVGIISEKMLQEAGGGTQ